MTVALEGGEGSVTLSLAKIIFFTADNGHYVGLLTNKSLHHYNI